MLHLHRDVLLIIGTHLLDNEKVTLASLCKSTHEYLFVFMYCEAIKHNKICGLSYFDNFENVILTKPDQILPQCAKCIHFTASITDLPARVTHLTFDHYFNESVAGCIPVTVTHLTFGDEYDQPIIDTIPSSVTHLVFRGSPNQPLVGCIPASVKYIDFGLGNFEQTFENVLPTSVTHLKLPDEYDQPIHNWLPSSLTHLRFGDIYDRSIRNSIPPNITHLTFGYEYNHPIAGCIPDSVTHLCFGARFNQPINGAIPASVTHLAFGVSFDQKIANHIPSSVVYLRINKALYKQIDDVPSSVSELAFGWDGYDNVKYLPMSVKTIIVTDPCDTNENYNDLIANVNRDVKIIRTNLFSDEISTYFFD